MQVTYNNYFLKLFSDEDVTIDNKKIEESVIEIINDGAINKITNYVSEILGYTSNRTFMKFDEKYIQTLYFGLLLNVKNFKIYSEYPSRLWYIDIYIEGNKKYMKDNIAIELKYIKKSEYNDLLLEKKKQEGMEQLKKYSEDDRLKITKKYLVIFSGNDVKVLESVE